MLDTNENSDYIKSVEVTEDNSHIWKLYTYMSFR
jgi:hypothetical protein